MLLDIGKFSEFFHTLLIAIFYAIELFQALIDGKLQTMFDLLDCHAVETLIELFNEELTGVASVGGGCFARLLSFALLLQFTDVLSHPSLFRP